MDDERARRAEQFREDAEAGDAEAQYQTGLCFYRSEAPPESIGERKLWDSAMRLSIRWFRKAAAQGHSAAIGKIGICFLYGLGVPKNPRIALKKIVIAAEAGDPEAQISLGCAYLSGTIVKGDDEQAYAWLHKAAVGGDAFSQSIIGDAYSYGRTLPRNKVMAARWYELAAEQGNSSAQYSLGFCYEHGTGIRKDQVKAYALYSLTCTGKYHLGNPEGALERLAEQMTPAQIEAGKKLAKEYALRFKTKQ